jgi:Ca-activated chloride channel family protein
VDLGAVLKQTVAAGRRGEFQERIQIRHIERFQWALAPALLCLLLSLWREFPVRPQVRSLPLSSKTGPRKSGAGTAAPNTGAPAAGASQRSTAAPAATVAVGLVLLSSLLFPLSGFAAEDTSVYAAPLSKLVEQLSAQPALSAADCASFAKETITWGKRLRDANQQVTPGPVHDALTGVDAGEKLSSHEADWAQLRNQLEDLLKKPPEPPPQKQKKQDQQQQQKQQEQNGGGNQADSRQEKSPQQQHTPDSQPKPQPPPTSPQANTGDTQKIGGQPRQPQGTKADPSLVLPIQKLNQLRNQDSPAELFQMLDNRDNKPPPQKGRDW